MNGGRSVSNVKNYFTLQIIWFALVMSVVIYVVVAYIFTTRSGFSPQQQVGIMFPILAAISAGLLLPQLVIRSSLSDDKLFPRILDEVRSRHPDAAVTQDPGYPLLLQNHMSLSIVIWALGEIPAIFGLVLTFLSGDIRYIAGFAIYSILNMFIFRPRRASFEDQLGRLRRYMATKG